jgi:hypothetical protein
MQEISGVGSALLVLLEWDDERKEFVQKLREQGVAVRIIIISDSKSPDAPDGASILKLKDVLSGNVRKL